MELTPLYEILRPFVRIRYSLIRPQAHCFSHLSLSLHCSCSFFCRKKREPFFLCGIYYFPGIYLPEKFSWTKGDISRLQWEREREGQICLSLALAPNGFSRETLIVKKCSSPISIRCILVLTATGTEVTAANIISESKSPFTSAIFFRLNWTNVILF